MKKRVLLIIFFAILSLINKIYSQDNLKNVDSKHFFYGCPLETPSSNNLILRSIYALSSNDNTKFADWVAYRLDISTITGAPLKKRNWKADPLLKDEETLEPNDYKNAYKTYQYEMGHLAPLASFKGSLDWMEANYLSNITPQMKNLNEGLWKYIEEKERELIKSNKYVYIYTGTLYEKPMPDLPSANESHIVPSSFWKIIIVPDNKFTCNCCAFIINQDATKKSNVMQYLTTIDEIEKRTRLDLFWKLDDSLENKIESNRNLNWCTKVMIKQTKK